MGELFKLILPPVLSLIIITLGNGFFNTFVTLKMSSFSEALILPGLIYSAYYAGMMVGSIYMEPLIRKIGHIRSFALFATLAALLVLVHGFIFSIFSWLAFRFLVGMTFAGLFIVIESWLLLVSAPSTRGKALSIYMIALYLSQGCGQFMLNIFQLEGHGAFIFTAILSFCSLLPVCLMKTTFPTFTETEKVSPFQLYQKAPVGFLGCLLAGFVLSSFYAIGPIYCKGEGMNLLQISQIMGFTILGALLFQSPLGYLSDRLERRKVIMLTAGGLFATCLAILFSGYYPFFFLVVLFTIYGGFAFALYPLSIGYCCDYVESSAMTAVAASCLMIYGTGCIVSPLIAPYFVTLLGPNGFILYLLIVALILLSITGSKWAQKYSPVKTSIEIPPAPQGSFPVEAPLLTKENKEE